MNVIPVILIYAIASAQDSELSLRVLLALLFSFTLYSQLNLVQGNSLPSCDAYMLSSLSLYSVEFRVGILAKSSPVTRTKEQRKRISWV